jgi:hypothetical protein
MCSVSLYRLWPQSSPASARAAETDAVRGATTAAPAAMAKTANKSRRPNSNLARSAPAINSEVTSPSRAHTRSHDSWIQLSAHDAWIQLPAHHCLDGHQFATYAGRHANGGNARLTFQKLDTGQRAFQSTFHHDPDRSPSMVQACACDRSNVMNEGDCHEP